jgi:hypothetical protein
MKRTSQGAARGCVRYHDGCVPSRFASPVRFDYLRDDPRRLAVADWQLPEQRCLSEHSRMLRGCPQIALPQAGRGHYGVHADWRLTRTRQADALGC